MPSKLLDRLRTFLDESPAVSDVMPAEHPDPHATPAERARVGSWPGGFGTVINSADIQTIVIHETSGWPMAAGKTTFIDRYTSHTTEDLGFGPQFYVSGDGTAFRLIDIDPPRKTWHATYVNGVSIGIENGDLGDGPKIGPTVVLAEIAKNHPKVNPDDPHEVPVPYTAAERETMRANVQAANAVFWHPLSGSTGAVAGRELYLLVKPASATAEAIPIWFGTTTYDGPQDMTGVGTAFHRMLFTEANFRSLVLLCRYLAEQFKIPRNFPALPYEQMENNIDSVTNYRKIVLSDERADTIAVGAGTTSTDLNGAGATAWYSNASQIQARTDGQYGFKRHNKAWRKMLDNSTHGGFRGIHGHGFAGDIFHYDNHSLCPGPFFDWHRFAREVWDWWWYPFDFTLTSTTSTTMRPYRHAVRSTVLRDYCFDAEGAESDYQSKRQTAKEGLTGANYFALPNATPVYAMANGTLVAAKFAIGSAGIGFILVRHEVFYQAAARSIDYDLEPAYVYSLIYYLDNLGSVFDNVSDANPDWLNRFVMRLKEAEAVVKYHTDNATNDPLNHAWTLVPGSNNHQRVSFGAQISRDATAYREIATALSSGQLALFPQEWRPGATPVRVALGDYLGNPGPAGETDTGVLIDIFSQVQLPTPTATDAPHPPVGVQLASVLSDADWKRISDALVFEVDANKELPNKVVYHYDVLFFLSWINGVTWQSEWKKYGLTDPDPAHPGAPSRPKSRR